jgi:hypothetical protein
VPATLVGNGRRQIAGFLRTRLSDIRPGDETQLTERGEKRLEAVLRLLHVHDCTMSITNGQQLTLD